MPSTLRCMSSARSATNLTFAGIFGLDHLDRSSYSPVSTIIALECTPLTLWRSFDITLSNRPHAHVESVYMWSSTRIFTDIFNLLLNSRPVLEATLIKSALPGSSHSRGWVNNQKQFPILLLFYHSVTAQCWFLIDYSIASRAGLAPAPSCSVVD